jgi:hypothetical protein
MIGGIQPRPQSASHPPVEQPHFLISGRSYAESDPRLQAALAAAYEASQRPRCLCVPAGVEMYIARHRAFVVKRMPDTGHLHHPACPSFEAQAGQSGLGELIGQAVIEHAPDAVELHVDFPMERSPGKAATGGDSRPPGEVRVQRRLMSLRALTHYLFERSGFNRWAPAMAGKRGQGVIHKYLGDSAHDIRLKGHRLADRLFIPEPFHQATHAEAAERRRRKLAFLHEDRGTGRFAMALLIGELKGSEPAHQGQRLWIKHMPDAPLLVPAKAWQRAERLYGPLLEARDADTHAPPRIVLSALIHAKREHIYQIDSLSLMLVHPQWIPLEGVHEIALVDALISQQRRFLKPLRYDARTAGEFPNALLLDAGDQPVAMHVVSDFVEPKEKAAKAGSVARLEVGAWVWHTGGPMPALPPKAGAARPAG